MFLAILVITFFRLKLQYPAGTLEVPLAISESSGISMQGSPITGAQVGYKRSAFIGSCKHEVWQAIRASSAAPYYLDDFSDGIIFLFLCTLGYLLAVVTIVCLIKLSMLGHFPFLFCCFFCNYINFFPTNFVQMYCAGKMVQ